MAQKLLDMNDVPGMKTSTVKCALPGSCHISLKNPTCSWRGQSREKHDDINRIKFKDGAGGDWWYQYCPHNVRCDVCAHRIIAARSPFSLCSVLHLLASVSLRRHFDYVCVEVAPYSHLTGQMDYDGVNYFKFLKTFFNESFFIRVRIFVEEKSDIIVFTPL